MDALGYDVANLQNVIFFLLPGLLTGLLFYYQIPSRRKTDLTIIVFSVIVSVVLTYITTLLFVAINYFFQLQIWPGTFWFEGTKIILSILLAISLASFVQSKGFSYINRKILKVNTPPFGRLWNTFFRFDKPVALKVTLLNGNSYIGLYNKSSLDPNDEVQELELTDLYLFKGEKGTITKIKESESVLILGSAITSVEKITDQEARKLYLLPMPKKKRK